MNSYKIDEEQVQKSNFETMPRLFRYLLKYKKRIALVFVLMAFGTGVDLINPLLNERAIDNYIIPGDLAGLIRIVLLGAVINILAVLAIKLRMYLMAKTSNKVIQELRQQLYDHIQSLDLAFFDSRPSGKILARIIGDSNSLKDIIENAVTTLIPNLVTVVAVMVIMFVKNWRLALAALCSLPFLIGGVFLISIMAEKHWKAKRQKSSNMNAFINEDLSGIKIIQSFRAEEETDKTFRELVWADRKEFLRAVRWCDGFGSWIDLCWSVGTMALYMVGIKILGIDNVSIGTYIAFGSYVGMFWQPILNLSNFYNQFVNAASGAERIFEIIDKKAEVTSKEDAKPMPEVKGDVEFKNVTFGYKKDVDVLKNVNFSVAQGETIALVGPTGAGKSTVVNLVSRFYDIRDGQILIDGKDIRDVELASLRTQMGIMTQDNYIFSGTIRENIMYGKLEASEEDMLAASRAVHADDFIRDLENGYDTKLTARGGELSNGQRQLVAFARTMLSNPRILILDEATSSIDTKTEILVQKGIANLLKGRTSFVIAHRLSTIQNADRIFVIDKGGIVESGSPEELMAKKGAYYALRQAQFS
ncbi:MAG: ABC transporter ATP-binding protein/permease [Treponema sp.]|nr:ABC transporter ATP-binding protein/permease [Treponema sp.]MCI7566788.1 ABC transporter ATP-binding protein/permease [Treponema sp.]